MASGACIGQSNEKQKRKQPQVGLRVPIHRDMGSKSILPLPSYGARHKIFNVFTLWFLLLSNGDNNGFHKNVLWTLNKIKLLAYCLPHEEGSTHEGVGKFLFLLNPLFHSPTHHIKNWVRKQRFKIHWVGHWGVGGKGGTKEERKGSFAYFTFFPGLSLCVSLTDWVKLHKI